MTTHVSVEQASARGEGSHAADLQGAAMQLHNGLLDQSVKLPDTRIGYELSFLTGEKTSWMVPSELKPRLSITQEDDGTLRVEYETGTDAPKGAPYGVYDATVHVLCLGEYSGRGVTIGTESVRRQLVRTGTCYADERDEYPIVDRKSLGERRKLTPEESIDWTERLLGFYTAGRENTIRAHERARNQGSSRHLGSFFALFGQNK